MIRNLLYTLLFAFVGTAAIGQVSFDPDVIEFIGEGEDQLFIEINITNNGSDTDIFWEFEKAAGYPDAWTTQICDANLCYAPNALKCSPNSPNFFQAGETRTFSVKVWNNNGAVEGNSHGILKLFSDSEFTVEIGETNPPTTSTSNVDLADVSVFPNPTTDFFQVSSDETIKAISIYNIVGREVMTMAHNTGMMHDVSTLRSGMYLLRLQDEDGDVVKTMRLSKR